MTVAAGGAAGYGGRRRARGRCRDNAAAAASGGGLAGVQGGSRHRQRILLRRGPRADVHGALDAVPGAVPRASDGPPPSRTRACCPAASALLQLAAGVCGSEVGRGAGGTQVQPVLKGRWCKLNPVEARVVGGLDSEGPGSQLLLQFIELLSGFPVNSNLRRYSEASACVAKMLTPPAPPGPHLPGPTHRRGGHVQLLPVVPARQGGVPGAHAAACPAAEISVPRHLRVGPARYCSSTPRHKVPFKSRDERAKRVLMTFGPG